MYANTILKGTDQRQKRIERNEVLEVLLSNIPHKTRDKNRTFNELQKRLLWNKFKFNPICPGKKCGGKELTWEDITVDHIKAWIKGGETSLENAQILCRRCNSSKRDK
jgi:5-methylcytosine-specific restriction endonuclease McrA